MSDSNGPLIVVRAETPEDYSSVHTVNSAAFGSALTGSGGVLSPAFHWSPSLKESSSATSSSVPSPSNRRTPRL
jgi:hypothetical protein